VTTSSWNDLLSGYPITLTSKYIAKILGISRRKVYKIMNLKGFPLVKDAG
jgi:hypothetical protein